jgi:hypothetical protein
VRSVWRDAMDNENGWTVADLYELHDMGIALLTLAPEVVYDKS